MAGHVLELGMGPLTDALALVSAICWLGVYAQAIRIGLAHKICCIPAEALALNFAWEFVFGFLWDPTLFEHIIQKYVNMAWCLLDVIIVFTCFAFGSKLKITNPLNQREKLDTERVWVEYFILVLAFAFAVMVGLFYEIGPFMQAMSAFLIGALMSCLFVRMALRFPHQPKSIGWLKFIGSGAITIVYLFDASSYPTICSLGVITMFLDIMYLKLIYGPNVTYDS